MAVDVLVEAGAWPPAAELQRLAEAAVAAAVGELGLPLAPDAELSLVFTDDGHIRDLNRRYRGKDAATDVLSFPAAPQFSAFFGPMLGDVVLARETIVNAAEAQGLTLGDHMTHLIVHGFLHLVGHDHAVPDDAAHMERLETAILARLGIADPYADS